MGAFAGSTSHRDLAHQHAAYGQHHFYSHHPTSGRHLVWLQFCHGNVVHGDGWLMGAQQEVGAVGVSDGYVAIVPMTVCSNPVKTCNIWRKRQAGSSTHSVER